MAKRGRKPREFTVPSINPQLSLMPEYEWDFVDVAVERVETAWELHKMMNPDGRPMHMAFSGGKDSICLFFVCKQAAEEVGVPMEQMFHVQYNVTNVDPPELVYFIRDVMKKQYPFIEMRHPDKSMWKLIVEKQMPPTRLVRYCCSALKEAHHEKGGYSLTGVRKAESVKRLKRKTFERLGPKETILSEEKILLNDNEDRRWQEFCLQKNAYMCNPIIDWTDEQVWRFIKGKSLPYCKLYDEGWARLGCLMCPMAPVREREKACNKYPGFAKCYIRAFQRMLDANPRGTWENGEDVFEWWIHGEGIKDRGQKEVLFDDSETN